MNSQNGSTAAMVKVSPSVSGPKKPTPPPAPAAKGVSYWQLAKGNKLVLVVFLVLGGIGGVFSTIFSTPLYQASTTVELVGFNQSFMGMNQVDPQAGTDVNTASSGNIQTQVRVLTSRTLLHRVFERMNLEVSPVISAPATIFTRLRKRVPFMHEEPLLQSREALSTAMRTVSVRPLGASRLIEISCQSTSPDIAAGFVNTLTSEHVSQSLAARSDITQRTSQWMESQMEESRGRLRDANNKLREFVQKSGMDFFPEQSTLADSKMRSLQADVAGVQADRIAKQARWEVARSTPSESLPDVMNDPILQQLKGQLATQKQQMAQLTANLTPEHPKVKPVQAQITETEQTLEKEKAGLLKRVQSDYEEALRKERLLAGAYNAQTHTVSAQSDKAGQYEMLKKDVETQQSLYNVLLQQSNQAALIALAPAGGVRVVDAASADPNPFSPKPVKDIVTDAMISGVLGYGLLFFREIKRRTKGTTMFEMPGHTQALLGVPELGVIPAAAIPAETKRRPLFGSAKILQAGSLNGRYVRNYREKQQPSGGVWDPDGSSLVAESFRQTLVSLLRNQPRDHKPVYVITSAGPGEGKTTLSANLARAMAEVGQRVLLVDADLRKPHLRNSYGEDNHEGLSDILCEPAELSGLSLRRYIQATPFNNLSVMTHGQAVVDSPGVLFFSARPGELIERLKTRFDCIVVDTAPTILFPDARLWGKHADGIVLVVRAGVTTREGASGACAQFENDGIPVLGTILNDWKPDPASRLGAYYYGPDYAQPAERS